MKAEWNTFPHLCHTPNGDISIRVYCYLPKGQTNELPILFYVHGLGGGNKDKGNGAEWLGTFAEEHHHVIVAPAFPRDEFPSEFYQLGTISSSWESYVPVAEEFWIYNNIEQLFDRVKSMLASKCETYKIFGHSAGGQFVHRFLNAMPDARVSRAVAANPGSWTFPVADGKIDDTGNVYGWPATVKDTPLAEDRRLPTGNAPTNTPRPAVSTATGSFSAFRKSPMKARRCSPPPSTGCFPINTLRNKAKTERFAKPKANVKCLVRAKRYVHLCHLLI